MEQIVPSFIEYVAEGYNAKLPDELNAFKTLDAYLTSNNYQKREMPTSASHTRRFVYWRENSTIVVTAEYAGKDIYVVDRATKTEAKLNSNTLPDFISRHLTNQPAQTVQHAAQLAR